jgi:hypothetical protein
VAVLAITVGIADAQDPTRAPIPLPSDPNEFVIVVDDLRKGGWVAVQPSPEPFLTIRADGRVQVVDVVNYSPESQGVLTPADLQDLLRFMIQEQDFFSLDPEGTYEPLPPEMANFRVYLDHGSRPFVFVQTAERRHRALVDLATMRKPSAQFVAVDKRLRRVAEEVKAGGKERVAEALRLVNEYMSQQRPALSPFTMEEFHSSQPWRTWQPTFFFSRPLGDGSSIDAVVELIAGEGPRVRVSTRVKEKEAEDLLEYLLGLVRARGLFNEPGR